MSQLVHRNSFTFFLNTFLLLLLLLFIYLCIIGVLVKKSLKRHLSNTKCRFLLNETKKQKKRNLKIEKFFLYFQTATSAEVCLSFSQFFNHKDNFPTLPTPEIVQKLFENEKKTTFFFHFM